ncbi:hypothetical protein EC900091_3648, partial [Escherichia coli 90.0091]
EEGSLLKKAAGV